MFGSCHVGFLGCYHTWSSSFHGDLIIIRPLTFMSRRCFVLVYLLTLNGNDIGRCICKSKAYRLYIYIYYTLSNTKRKYIWTYWHILTVSKCQHVTTWQFLHMQPKSTVASTSPFVSTYHAQPGILQSKAEITAIPKHCVPMSSSIIWRPFNWEISAFCACTKPCDGGFETSVWPWDPQALDLIIVSST